MRGKKMNLQNQQSQLPFEIQMMILPENDQYTISRQ